MNPQPIADLLDAEERIQDCIGKIRLVGLSMQALVEGVGGSVGKETYSGVWQVTNEIVDELKRVCAYLDLNLYTTNRLKMNFNSKSP